MSDQTSAAGVQIPYDVLLVEDNAADAALLQRVFRQLGLRHRLHVVLDGHEAMAFLTRQGAHADAPRPALIWLDLNLPRLHGREVLSQVKSHASLRTIPVMVFSSSSAECDVQESYERGANAYLVKPFELKELVNMVSVAVDFWLSKVLLAPAPSLAQ
jgi:two-component system, chemotaxis family, response regulator Rcp1